MFFHKPVSDWIRFLKSKGIGVQSTINDNPILNESLFYLVESKEYIFICDELTQFEVHYLTLLATKEKKSIVIGFSGGEFAIIHNGWNSNKFELKPKNNAFLCKCDDCGEYWFGNIEGIYTCSACDVYSGGHLPSGTVTGDCKLW